FPSVSWISQRDLILISQSWFMTERIVSTEDVMGGKPRIEGTRIRVVDVVGYYEERQLSPEEIAEKFDLELEDVYAALVYYYEHPREIRRQMHGEMEEKAVA
ncbi:MAG: DUF433 domain-containing protein, partial [Candidatus Aenigmatarchaeota archaeon]